MPHDYTEIYYTYTVMGVEHQGKSKMDSLLGLRSTVEKKALAYLPGAHHGLEIDGDVPGSVRLMERIVEAVEEFVREGLLPERSS